jgi:glutaredoxin
MSGVVEFVNKAVSTHAVVVFSKSYCPYCVRAKNALDGVVKGGRAGYVSFELDERSDGPEIQVRRSASGQRGVGGLPGLLDKGRRLVAMQATVKDVVDKATCGAGLHHRLPPTIASLLSLPRPPTLIFTGLPRPADGRVHRAARLHPRPLLRWGR